MKVPWRSQTLEPLGDLQGMFPGRCVPAGLSNVKHLLLRKTDVLKTSIFSKKKLIKCSSFEEQKGTRYIRGKAFFGIIVFSRLSLISFNLFFSGDKRLLSEFLREWGWFHGHNERFPKYLGYKLKFQKSETPLCRWKSNDYKDMNIFLPLENPFLFAKEKTWKRICITNSKLSENRTEK